MELTTFIITVLGFVIAVITYKNVYIQEPKEDTKFLIRKYDNAAQATLSLINDLKNYSSSNMLHNELFKEGLTFAQGIEFLESANTALFTQENRNSLFDSKIGKRQVDELLKRIDIHRENVEAIQTHLNFYFKKEFDVSKRLM